MKINDAWIFWKFCAYSMKNFILGPYLHQLFQTVVAQMTHNINGIPWRRKICNLQDKTAVLVFYERPDTPGPKLSTYHKTMLNEQGSEEMKKILSSSNGVLGIVKKTRHIYFVDQTRIHVDEVEGLGHFMELEVRILLFYGFLFHNRRKKWLNDCIVCIFDT